MRFVLSVALKYLLPKSRQLSVSIISLVSILVISLVVWLVIVFLSVTEGIETNWTKQLVSLNAPLRMTPTEAYYKSYYYQIDQVSLQSNYSAKTIGEKLISSEADPYDPSFDAEVPADFPKPDLKADGSLKDIVKESWETILKCKKHGVMEPEEYEVSLGNLHLSMVHENPLSKERSQTFLTQASYITSFSEANPSVKMVRPETTEKGSGIVIAKNFQNNGVLAGDAGHISYYTQTTSGIQEQRLPIYVAGFYDPGFMPVGSKLIFVDQMLISMLRSNISIADTMLGNGIHLWTPSLKEAVETKKELQKALEEGGLSKYWKVEAFSDYEFARPVLEQLQSDKTLFSLIAVIILIVACSNIISMLLLLVNDKKKEIGILQSMGASSFRVAAIFGTCGFFTGLVSSIIGIATASLTLKHLQGLVNFLSFLQGHEAFHAAFYGEMLPNELSMHSLTFVLIATTLISLLAGIVPAIKASRIRPAETLRSE